MRTRLLPLLPLVVIVATLPACGGGAAAPATPRAEEPATATGLRATIRWTSHGVPHIVADDLASLSFGQGYAFARLHVCVLADQIVKVRGERARYFGPGPGGAHLESDFGHLHLGLRERAGRELAGLSDEGRAVVSGYVAGYNHYLARTPAAELPAACRGAEWLRPIDELDLLAYGAAVSLLASSGAFLDSIAAARPPGKDGATGRAPLPRWSAAASNAWALGAERAGGGGALVANPHFPWEGALRFYEAHLTIPGDLDAYGATVLGLPLLSIAFNRDLAWTHTVSSSRRFTLYRLTLDADDPTRYRYGAGTRAMSGRTYRIEVRGEDGRLSTVERTLYRSHYGPLLATGQMAWTGDTAFAIRDAAAGPDRSIDQYLAMMRAADLDAFRAALHRYQSTPFVNTLYADRAGNAFYIDGSRVPMLSDQALSAWRLGRRAMPALEEAWRQGIVVLDGSLPLFEWEEHPDAVAPGTVPPTLAPQLLRHDFVFNANDPYWMTNPAAPLTGFSPLYGEAERPLSSRSRMNLVTLAELGDGASRDDLAAALLSNRALTAELLRADMVERCRAIAGRKKPAPPEGLGAACDALAGWDGRFELDSRGAALWRELFGALPRGATTDRGPLWAEPFDPSRPLMTPRGLAPPPADGDDPLEEALATALARLAEAGVAPDAPLGQVQFTEKGDRRIGVHGGGRAEGVANLALYAPDRTTLLPGLEPGTFVNPATGLTSRGYPVTYGTSFLMIVELGEGGPVAEGLLTYSASSDPRSPYFADQTEMYARKELRPLLFSEEQIAADPALEIEVVEVKN